MLRQNIRPQKAMILERWLYGRGACLALMLGSLVAWNCCPVRAQSPDNLSIKLPGYNSLTSEELRDFGASHIHEVDWNNLWEQRSAFVSSWHAVLNQTGLAKEIALKNAIGEQLCDEIDPWGDIDQEILIRPELPPLTYWNGTTADTPLPKDLALAIPDRYRLAEAMGTGTNSIHIEISTEEGELFTAVTYGFHLSHRVRHTLVGQFWLKGEHSPFQTFRHSIVSRGRIDTQDVNFGPEVKPHQIGLKRRPVELLNKSHFGKRLWDFERLDLQYPKGFNAIMLAPEETAKQRPIEHRIEKAMRNQFQSLRKSVVQSQWSQLERHGLPSTIDTTMAFFDDWETKHHDATACHLGIHVCRLMGSDQLRQRIESQLPADQAEWKPNLSFLRNIELTLNSSIAHGLYHRVPVSAREKALRLWINIIHEALWTP